MNFIYKFYFVNEMIDLLKSIQSTKTNVIEYRSVIYGALYVKTYVSYLPYLN